MKIKRFVSIDILKVIGVLCIILAHVNPPQIISIIRTFDVVLMMLVSAYLGIKTINKENFINYSVKRFKRLVLPTWSFLVIFFIISYFFKLSLVDKETLIHTFLLTDYGIGFVWVIRVYLIISLLIPLFNYLKNKFKKSIIFIITILLFMIYEFLCYKGLFKMDYYGNYVLYLKYILSYIIPCFLIINISDFLFETKKKNLILFLVINVLIEIVLGYYLYKKYGIFQSFSTMKYPLRLYYLSYGFVISSLLILILKNKKIVDFLDNKIVLFISKNSLWIYLWHMLFIYIFQKMNLNWLIMYLFVLVLSIVVTYVQNFIISKMKKNRS